MSAMMASCWGKGILPSSMQTAPYTGDLLGAAGARALESPAARHPRAFDVCESIDDSPYSTTTHHPRAARLRSLILEWLQYGPTTLVLIYCPTSKTMPYLSEGQLAAMAFDHKYASSGGSLLDGLIMQKFWNHIVTWLPLKHDPQAVLHWLFECPIVFRIAILSDRQHLTCMHTRQERAQHHDFRWIDLHAPPDRHLGHLLL